MQDLGLQNAYPSSGSRDLQARSVAPKFPACFLPAIGGPRLQSGAKGICGTARLPGRLFSSLLPLLLQTCERILESVDKLNKGAHFISVVAGVCVRGVRAGGQA